MIKIFISLLVTFAVTSCSLHSAYTANEAKTNLIGLSKLELYECAGTPSRKENIGDIEFLTFFSDGGSDGYVTAGGSYTSERTYCEVTFKIKNGKITKVNYSGNSGGLLSHNAQCADIVEKCIR